jgi:uncharacterized membrane protein
MGILDNLKNIFGKKEESSIPFSVRAHFVPIRLDAYKNNSATLFITVKNLKNEQLLTSIDISCDKQLGLDQSGITKRKEIRLGFLKENEEREIKVPIYSSVTTPPGEYEITVTVIAHYRTYEYVNNSVKISQYLRVV